MKLSFKTLQFRMEEVGQPVMYRPGEKIIIQGHRNESFYLIKTGRVEMYSEGVTNKHPLILSSGEYFGEITCLTGEDSIAAYAALDEVVLLKTGREDLMRLMSELPDFNQQVVDSLCKIIRVEKSGQKSELTAPDLPGAGSCSTGRQAAPGRPRIGLALGAGVVRGMAHIGVIRTLLKNKIPIDLIVGTSAGALVGACFAAGVSVDELESFATKLSWSKVASPVIPPGRAFMTNEKLGHLVDRLIGEKQFSDINIPLAVIAADASSGEEVVIREGKVSDAIRASTAIPAVFEPVHLFNRILVDGGTVNMVPASVCRAMGADIVIAVSVSDFHHQTGPPKNIVMAMLRCFDLVLKKQVVMSKVQWADVVISVQRPDLSGYSFRECRQFIREGERRAERMMPVIKNLIGQYCSRA
ncbi:MAG: patatin-like phospholipase family protein [Bacillota bacterium]